MWSLPSKKASRLNQCPLHDTVFRVSRPRSRCGGMSEQSDSEQFLNISIVDSKHFLEPEHLFTELATSDGCVLFECASLLKANGIDLMNCPLQISLKIFVRRRDEGTPILHHMVLPLAVISKQVLQPPHEWETWVGLLPSNNSLEVCAPSDMFAHAVINLLADKTSPKLRLKFRPLTARVNRYTAFTRESSYKMLDICWVGTIPFYNLKAGLRTPGQLSTKAITILSSMPIWHSRSRVKKRDVNSKIW